MRPALLQFLLSTFAVGDIDGVLNELSHLTMAIQNRVTIHFEVVRVTLRVVACVLHGDRLLCPASLGQRTGVLAAATRFAGMIYQFMAGNCGCVRRQSAGRVAHENLVRRSVYNIEGIGQGRKNILHELVVTCQLLHYAFPFIDLGHPAFASPFQLSLNAPQDDVKHHEKHCPHDETGNDSDNRQCPEG